MVKRKNQVLIDSDSEGSDASDLDSVSHFFKIYFIIFTKFPP